MLQTLRVLLVLLAFAHTALAGPNVVIILADDLGINDLGCYGRQDHRTPHLDALAAAGTRCTTAYAACSVCSPTRAALMTGLAPARLHLTTFLPGRGDNPAQAILHPTIAQHLPADVPTLAQRFRAAGYATACVGKWHLGGKAHQPTDHGFAVALASPATTKPSATEGGKGEFALTEQATQFIRQHHQQPFLLYLAHNNPHIPYAAQPERVAKYPMAFEPTYAAVIDTLDEAVGKVLATLDELKLTENTLVLFTSDNGGLHIQEGPHPRITHNTPYRAGKGHLYEGGHRVPAIVRWPGHVPAGQTYTSPLISTDWLPTLLELAQLPALPLSDGVSQAAALKRGPVPAERSLFWHQPHYTNQGGRPGAAIRRGDWKLIQLYDAPAPELYDLARDPGEAKNLAATEPKRVAELLAALDAWRKDVQAQMPVPNPKHDPARFRKLYVDFDPSQYQPLTADAATTARVAQWRKDMNAAGAK
jgi:arylsulfatase A-like enzyme